MRETREILKRVIGRNNEKKKYMQQINCFINGYRSCIYVRTYQCICR